MMLIIYILDALNSPPQSHQADRTLALIFKHLMLVWKLSSSLRDRRDSQIELNAMDCKRLIENKRKNIAIEYLTKDLYCKDSALMQLCASTLLPFNSKVYNC